MATPGNITEIDITSTQGKTGLFSNQCPFDSGTTQRRDWFLYLAAELNKAVGNKTFRLVCADGAYQLDRSLVSAVTITYS